MGRLRPFWMSVRPDRAVWAQSGHKRTIAATPLRHIAMLGHGKSHFGLSALRGEANEGSDPDLLGCGLVYADPLGAFET